MKDQRTIPIFHRRCRQRKNWRKIQIQSILISKEKMIRINEMKKKKIFLKRFQRRKNNDEQKAKLWKLVFSHRFKSRKRHWFYLMKFERFYEEKSVRKIRLNFISFSSDWNVNGRWSFLVLSEKVARNSEKTDHSHVKQSDKSWKGDYSSIKIRILWIDSSWRAWLCKKCLLFAIWLKRFSSQWFQELIETFLRLVLLSENLEIVPENALKALIERYSGDVRRILIELQYLSQSEKSEKLFCPKSKLTKDQGQWQSSSVFDAIFYSRLNEQWNSSPLEPLFDQLTRDYTDKYNRTHQTLVEAHGNNQQRSVRGVFSTTNHAFLSSQLESNCLTRSNCLCRNRNLWISVKIPRSISIIGRLFEKFVEMKKEKLLTIKGNFWC